MGYRSEVFIKIDLKHKDELNQILKENDLLDCFRTTNDENYYYAYGIWLKSYKKYKSIDVLVNFIKNDEKKNSKAMLAIEDNSNIIYWGAYRQVDLLAICDINSRSFPVLQLR